MLLPEDVAAPGGWGTMQTLLGLGFWGQPDHVRPPVTSWLGFFFQMRCNDPF